jgi:serine/threonine protein phosphatase PrpC
MHINSVNVAAEKGNRDYMEDRYISYDKPEGILLAVFDGHGGSEASTYAWGKLAPYFFESLAFFKEEFPSEKQVTYALRDAIKQLAVHLADCEAGTTLSAVFIPTEGEMAYTAVLGDSPIIIKSESRDEVLGMTHFTTWVGPDHNVRSNPTERMAAEARGGYCDGAYLYRNMHSQGLQMARALGDSHLRGVISTEPEINEVPIVGSGFILVATDGLFDPAHRKFEESKRQVLALIKDGADAQYLVDNAVLRDTYDNATAILARF